MTHPTIKIKFLLFSLFILSQSVSPQVLESVQIKGARDFSISQYNDWIKIGRGTKIFPGIQDSIRSRLSSNLSNNGYLNFTIENISLFFSEDSQKVDLSVDIREGKPTYLGKVYVSRAAREDSILIAEKFERILSEILITTEIENVILEILEVYENRGYPFAALNIESLYFYADSSEKENFCDLHLSFEKNQKSSIDKVEILGNTKTKDYVILRQIGFIGGEEYSQEKIDEIPKRLNRLKFFDPVPLPVFYFNSKDEGVLQITVKEKETNNFDGILGYVPAKRESEKGYFTGYVNISLRNLFGTGRAAAVRWQQETRYSQELELKYLEPWILDFPINVSLGLFQRKQDTTYVQRKLEGAVEYIASDDITASLILSTETTIPTVQAVPRFTVFNSSAFTTGLNLKIDTRDDFYAPTEGILFLNTYKFSSKKINGPAEYILPTTETNYYLQRLELDLSMFYEIFIGHIAALGLHAREMRGSLFEISDLYLLGGANTLRGYREKQFMGNRIFWSNLEYRYLLTRRSFAFLFLDTGYFLRNEDKERNIEKVSDFKIGYGLGINIETGLGVLSVSYALGEGDSFNEGKIHFGLINEF